MSRKVGPGWNFIIVCWGAFLNTSEYAWYLLPDIFLWLILQLKEHRHPDL
jgi:hypothetical protein